MMQHSKKSIKRRRERETYIKATEIIFIFGNKE